MTSKLLGILFLIAGLIIPFSREAMRPIDWIIMLCFLGCGAASLFLMWKKRTTADDIYRIQLEFQGIDLFDSPGVPSLFVGQQLFIDAYAGVTKDSIHLVTEQGAFVAALPCEHKEHVLYKYENHCPIHLVVRGVELCDDASSYTLSVDLMC